MDRSWFLGPRTYLGLEGADAEFSSARVVILPAPYDSTTCFKAGSRHGPQAILDNSTQVELYDPELGYEISRAGFHTLPELEPQVGDPRHMVERVERVTRELIDQGKFVALLGGEHLLSAGTARAHAAAYPDLTVLQFDAHADLRDVYMGTKYSHACTARRMLESAPLVQVGIRSLCTEEREFLAARPDVLTVYDSDEPWDDARIERLVEHLGPNVFVSLDLDVLDPAIMSAVGTPEPGGLTWYTMLRIMRGVSKRRRVVGLDVVELCPPEGPEACSYLAAKLSYKLIGYALHPWEQTPPVH